MALPATPLSLDVPCHSLSIKEIPSAPNRRSICSHTIIICRMKFLLTTFVLLFPSASTLSIDVDEESLSANDGHQLRHNDNAGFAMQIDINSSSSSSKIQYDGRYLAHGEKRKQRKENRNKAAAEAAAQDVSTAETESETADQSSSSNNDELAMQQVRSSYVRSSSSSSSNNNNRNNNKETSLHVSRVYTYGAPSVAKGPPMSNPNNACIPGLRIYTEDVTTISCQWWQKWWCTSGRQVTNVDFASQTNVKEGYPHPKMSTLVLRQVDGSSNVEYTYKPCRSYDNVIDDCQWWPKSDEASNMIRNNIHGLDDHYEQRLVQIPKYVRGPALEYVSVARCSYKSSYDEIQTCLKQYNTETFSRLGGVASLGWEPFAYMVHTEERTVGFLSDTDIVYVVKKDERDYYYNNNKSNNNRDTSHRKCIIVFQGSDKTADFANFALGSNDSTDYCGRSGVHTGVSNELWKITHNPQYATVIKPALETCDDVTCVGHSLGGALCNVFTMCANQGLENLNKGWSNTNNDEREMWDDYNSLIWTKKEQD